MIFRHFKLSNTYSFNTLFSSLSMSFYQIINISHLSYQCSNFFSLKVYAPLGCSGAHNKRRMNQPSSSKKIRHRKAEDILKNPAQKHSRRSPIQTTTNSSWKTSSTTYS